MRGALLALMASFLICGVPAVSQTPPDFSGTWKMDPSRSESAHQDVPIGSVALAIRQTASEFAVETRRAASKGSPSSNETLTFQLDGSEATMAGTSGVPIRVKARWDGPKLVAETAREMNGATVTTTQSFQLGASGKELTVQKTLTVQHGYQGVVPEKSSTGSGTDVFVKLGKRE